MITYDNSRTNRKVLPTSLGLCAFFDNVTLFFEPAQKYSLWFVWRSKPFTKQITCRTNIHVSPRISHRSSNSQVKLLHWKLKLHRHWRSQWNEVLTIGHWGHFQRTSEYGITKQVKWFWKIVLCRWGSLLFSVFLFFTLAMNIAPVNLIRKQIKGSGCAIWMDSSAAQQCNIRRQFPKKIRLLPTSVALTRFLRHHSSVYFGSISPTTKPGCDPVPLVQQQWFVLRLKQLQWPCGQAGSESVPATWQFLLSSRTPTLFAQSLALLAWFA